ncbi:hypothetical protein ACT4US_17825 [Bacillus sp. HC-Mk]
MKKKQVISIIAGEETYENLASFQTLKELNHLFLFHKGSSPLKIKKQQYATKCKQTVAEEPLRTVK